MVDHSLSTDFKKILHEAEPNTYLYQLKFKLPEAFYTDVIGNTTAYRINNFIPDFLYIRQDPVTKVRKILIIDAKSSKEMSKSHQFQVTSYAFFLEYLIRDIRNLEIDEMGGVWLPNDLDKPITFRIDFVLNKIKFIYMNTLIEISNNSDPDWILGKKCTTCQFLTRCKGDAKGTVRSIPYMDQAKASRLKESVVDIEDLSELLQNLKIESQTSSTGYESYIDAYTDTKPQFLGHASVTIAKETDHAIYIYLQVDNFSQKPFLYGIEITDSESNQKILNRYYATDYDKHIEHQVETYSAFVDNFVSDLALTLSLMDEVSSRCLIYVYNGLEKSVIQSMLTNIVSSEGKDLITLNQARKEEIVSDAMRCLVVLFQDTQLLGLPGVVDFPSMDDIQRTSSVGRFVSIEDILQQNIALGVSGFYSLFDAVTWMAEAFIQDEDDDLSGLDLNDIYNSWKGPHVEDELRYSTQHYVSQRFFWLQEIMQTFWSLANRYMEDSDCELFPLICKVFQWPVVQPFRNPILAKLVFFRQLECIKACDDLRMDRIRDLSRIDHAGMGETNTGGLILDLVGQQRVNQYVTHLRFAIRPLTNGPYVQQKIDRLSIDTFKRYILVPDTREDIISTIQYSDLLYLNKTNYVKHAIRCVNVAEINGDEVVLAGASIPSTITSTRYRLYQRYVDFTTLANIEGLKRLDEQEDMDVIKLIEDPNSWADIHDETSHLDATAIKLRDAFSMSPSQKDISANILEKRLQIIWGPPGSGKTEFLALFVNWFIQCSSKKDILIGVTAFTRDAIFNLLKRIEKIQKRHGFTNLFSIIYVHGPTNDKTFDDDSNMIGCTWDKSYSLIRGMNKDEAKPNIYVMGATVWSWDKIRTKWKTFKGCDMLILDESTQVLVSDALLAIACLKRPNGKLIIAGDHMQLGPIIKNDYSNTISRLDDPLLFGSIQQCLMRTKENHAIPTREFLLQKGALHDFGPNTLQLKDNWRMNEELNEFFQQVYGPDYTSRYPKIKLHLDWTGIEDPKLNLIQRILDPTQAMTLVKLEGFGFDNSVVEAEADVVKTIVELYLEARQTNVSPAHIPVHRDTDEPKVMIVTPHNKQRIAIKRRVPSAVPVDTVEKMQGQECDFIIACFSCASSHQRNYQFLRDFRRWNVALSRAR
ncbi:uncharacterized protein EV154DRAFT_424222 [Mucor mucedo]|uniref:uncharacterized protein n=1 Tax=Mucor mucedo TaxID=29922 RepID=UPI00221E3C54|nr:uncharacterized protein EV154DRAFT_424222 [Mucor mucedo]KAI7889188.1 hypothetical protein EV154DRAFT_424222 [Mucor mucedo]